MADYCNITTDLQRVFSRIEDYQAKEIIENWTQNGVGAKTYRKQGTGFVNYVLEDGTELELQTSIANVEATTQAFYYESSADILFIHPENSDDPADHILEVGENWDAFKTSMRNKAQQILDSYLNAKYQTPLMPRTRRLHDTSEYEYVVVRIAALLTCWLIINRIDPVDETGRVLYKEAYNNDPETGESKGLINQLLDGDMILQDQISTRERGKWNVYPYTSNSVEYEPLLSGVYTGSQYKIWRLQVDAVGAPGTGTFKVSYDGGSTWDLTEQDMKDSDSDEYRMYITDGIYVYFPNVSYGEGDYWDIELHPLSDTATNAGIFSIGMSR